jgi:hypothetical protein
MSNTKYTDLFNEVLPELPGVGTALVENAIRNAVIKFCADSWCWKHYPDAQSVVAAQSDYDLEAPVGADVAAVMRFTLDGAPLDPLQSDDTLDTTRVRIRAAGAVHRSAVPRAGREHHGRPAVRARGAAAPRERVVPIVDFRAVSRRAGSGRQVAPVADAGQAVEQRGARRGLPQHVRR